MSWNENVFIFNWRRFNGQLSFHSEYIASLQRTHCTFGFFFLRWINKYMLFGMALHKLYKQVSSSRLLNAKYCFYALYFVFRNENGINLFSLEAHWLPIHLVFWILIKWNFKADRTPSESLWINCHFDVQNYFEFAIIYSTVLRHSPFTINNSKILEYSISCAAVFIIMV